MTSKLSSFQNPASLRSQLFKHPPDAVPSIEDLEALQTELKLARQKSAERARKAEEDLRHIQDSMRRMVEKEKGKSRILDRVKRERGLTPGSEADDSRHSSVAHSSKPRFTSQGLPPSAARAKAASSRTSSIIQKKDRKRVREGGDSDDDRESQRPRKSTPPVPNPISKLPKSIASIAAPPHAKTASTSSAPDFSQPSSDALLPTNLYPTRPKTPPLPTATPTDPTKIMHDFSNVKPPNSQIQMATFWTSVEQWVRPIKEEDIGFLEYVADEVEPFIMPKLGRNYLEVWEEQDAGRLPLTGTFPAPPSYFSAPAPKWDPSTLAEGDLVAEEKGHGPLTERVISALLPNPDSTSWKGVKAAEDAMEGRPGGSGAAAARRERLNVTDLEARIRDMMRSHGLIDSMPDFTEKVDDPIATALREAQAELRRVIAVNKARKARLVPIARDRLGYQEYLELRDSIDKNITNLYAKLQKKDIPKANKKKKKPLTGAAAASANGSMDPDPPPPQPLCPAAALGLSPDEEDRLRVDERLIELVQTRRQWVDTVGAIFEQKQREHPGRLWGLPPESIFQGIEEEVSDVVDATEPSESRAPLNGQSRQTSQRVSLKGKERATSDAMDIG